jgi:hypothetical protein
VSNNASNQAHWRVSQKRSQRTKNEALRDAVQQRDHRRSEQNQGSGYCHKEKVLHHMGSEESMV